MAGEAREEDAEQLMTTESVVSLLLEMPWVQRLFTSEEVLCDGVLVSGRCTNTARWVIQLLHARSVRAGDYSKTVRYCTHHLFYGGLHANVDEHVRTIEWLRCHHPEIVV